MIDIPNTIRDPKIFSDLSEPNTKNAITLNIRLKNSTSKITGLK